MRFQDRYLYNSALWVTIAWYTRSDDPRDGDPRRVGGQPDLLVEGEDRTDVINLAGWPGELNINCHDGPTYKMSGTVSGETGDVREGYEVLAYPDTDYSVRTPLHWYYTDETGTFSIEAPDGYSYWLQILDNCGSLVGAYHEDELLLRYEDNGPARATRILVDGADVSGIDIVIPGALDTLDECPAP